MESNYTPFSVETGSGDGDQPGYDENGEEILYRAECNKCQVFCGLCTIAFLSGLLLGIVLVLPCILFTYYARVNNWKLYLTKRGVHHVNSNGCTTKRLFLSLEEIQRIYWLENNVYLKVGPEKVSLVRICIIMNLLFVRLR